MGIGLQTCALTQLQAERPSSPIMPPHTPQPAVAHAAFKTLGREGKSQFPLLNTFQLITDTITTAEITLDSAFGQ